MLKLITELTSQLEPIKPIKMPQKIMCYIFFMLVIYAIIMQFFLGIRVDILTQLTNWQFIVEIILTLMLFASSLAASVLTMYPDFYQKSQLLKLPYVFFFLLLSFLIAQLFMFENRQILDKHTIECTICIMFLALIPSVIIFVILQKGATIVPLKSGLFAVLAASSLGCVIIGFNEANNSIIHILEWHYLPMIFFAIIGMLLGKWLFVIHRHP